MKKNRKVLMAMTLIATLLLAACAGTSAPSTTPAPSPNQNNQTVADSGERALVVGLSMNTLANPFFVDVRDGVQREADELGIELHITDSQGDPATQLRDIENLLQRNLDAIIINPTDSDAIVASIEAANAAGVPVFTMDRQATGGEVVAHIGYNAIRSGNIAGQFLVDTLNGQGNIVELQGIMGTNVAQDRSRGFNEVISQHPNMTIVATAVANFNRAEAMSVMENILQANPNIDGIYAANDEMLLGALEAVEAAGRKGEIVMIGCDAIDDTIAAIKEGRVEATIAEPPFFLGRAIMNTAWEYMNGTPVEALVVLENNLVTIDNVFDLVTRN